MNGILDAIPLLFGARDDGYARFAHAAVAATMSQRSVQKTQQQLQAAYESVVSEIEQERQRNAARKPE